MNVGYAQVVINPNLEPPVYMAGFGQNRIARTIHDDLYGRVIALQDENTTLVLCSLDLIGFFRPDVQDVIRRVETAERFVSGNNSVPEIIISSVHPHHGPDTMGLYGPDDRTSGVNPEYMASLKEKISHAILSALDDLQPVEGMRFASLRVPGLAKNARDAAIVDDALIVLQFIGMDQQVKANLFNFACHPEVLWVDNPHITADFPGYLRRKVEELTDAPCLFLSADLGGMMTPDVKDHIFEEAEIIGNTLAKAGIDAVEKAALLSSVPLALRKKLIHVRLTNILFKIAMKRGLFPDVRDGHGNIHSEVNLVRIGPVWFATVPGELLPKLGMDIKAALRKAGASIAGVLGLANDELGYILPKTDFRYPINPFKPGKHYEETNSLSKEIGPVVVAAVQELLEQ